MSCTGNTGNDCCGVLKTMSILAAGFGAALAVGYCIYFDHKRRSAPDFRQRLRERRRAARQAAASGQGTPARRLNVNMPDPEDPDAVLRFFLDQVRNAEDRLAMGDMDGGAEHLSYAVTVCSQPTRLLQSLQATLPPEAYQRLQELLQA